MVTQRVRALIWLVLAMAVFGSHGTAVVAQDAVARRANPGSPASPAPLVEKVGAEVSFDSANYPLRVGDVLEIKVYEEDDLNTEVRVDQEGGIELALLGRVKVESLTVEAARQLITARYHAEYVINPRVTLAIKEFAPRRFSVMGEVARPGFFEIPARQKVNLLQAIAMAGGYTRLADPSKIRIRRITAKGEEILKFNGKELSSETAKELPIILNDDNITIAASIF